MKIYAIIVLFITLPITCMHSLLRTPIIQLSNKRLLCTKNTIPDRLKQIADMVEAKHQIIHSEFLIKSLKKDHIDLLQKKRELIPSDIFLLQIGIALSNGKTPEGNLYKELTEYIFDQYRNHYQRWGHKRPNELYIKIYENTLNQFFTYLKDKPNYPDSSTRSVYDYDIDDKDIPLSIPFPPVKIDEDDNHHSHDLNNNSTTDSENAGKRN